MAARLFLQPHRWVDPHPARGTPVYRVHREGLQTLALYPGKWKPHSSVEDRTIASGTRPHQGPEGRPLNVSPARKGWVLEFLHTSELRIGRRKTFLPNGSMNRLSCASPGLLVRGSGFSNPRERSGIQIQGFSPGGGASIMVPPAPACRGSAIGAAPQSATHSRDD
jgi:hypothetical protein